MKVVSSKQMASIEAKAYKNGASDAEFMEAAGRGVALAAHAYIEENSLPKKAILICGKGNNAGDAYVAGINLLSLGYDVMALQAAPISTCSKLCQHNHNIFVSVGGVFTEVKNAEEIIFPKQGLIIDGVFGTGFKGTPGEPYASLIKAANASGLPILAIDIPSGLDGETGEVLGAAITATETAFLGLPKAGFFLRDGWNHVGKLHYVDFGLPQEYIDEEVPQFELLTLEKMRQLLPVIVRNRHKYQRGLVVGLAGSPTMPGAAMLAGWSALRGGAGIIRLLHPEGMESQLACSPFELIKIPYRYEGTEPILEALNKASATFIGPGLGTTPEVQKMLRNILPQLQKPCVLDADALTFISEEENVALPKHCILTPHMGEMDRLLKAKHSFVDKALLELCQKYADEKEATLILKGGPTFIFEKNKPISVNPTGDPGMAAAGSGDVLTGLLAALLAQGLNPYDAARLGVFMHGVAGELGALENTSYSEVASDILHQFPDVYRLLKETD